MVDNFLETTRLVKRIAGTVSNHAIPAFSKFNLKFYRSYL